MESSQTGAHSAHKTPGHDQGPGAWWWVVPTSYVGWGSTLGARKLISGKNRLKISAQSELRISRNIRNSFRPDLGNAKQKRTEREIQSRRGSCPPPPWRPWTRGGTLLPSRGEAKEEEGGGLSPPLCGGVTLFPAVISTETWCSTPYITNDLWLSYDV